jgi:hypothetical protein
LMACNHRIISRFGPPIIAEGLSVVSRKKRQGFACQGTQNRAD